MDLKEYKVKIELTENLLGTVPKNKDVYAKYVATKSPNAEEEVATVQEVEDRGWTGFHADEKGPFLYDYAIKGFLCEAARTIKQFGATKQLQDKFKRFSFVFGEKGSRKVRLPKISDTPLERPLRAMTAQGPRVTVTRSDVVEAPAVITFTVKILDGGSITEGCLREVLGYGELCGLGQWRTGSWGRFRVLELEEV